MSLLTLDRSTLFYWGLSDSYLEKGEKNTSALGAWAASIPSGAKPASQAPSRVTTSTSTRPKSIVPALTSGSSRLSARSVLTDEITIVHHPSRGGGAQSAAEQPNITVDSDGGLSDANEIKGEEREAAVRSPPKGKKRVNNEVSFFCWYIIITYVVSNLATRSSKDQ